MKSIIITLLTILSHSFIFGQDRTGIATSEFTLNGKPNSDKYLLQIRETFERIMSEQKFTTIGRDNDDMNMILGKIREEVNLHKDFGKEFKSKMELANVDWLVTGDIIDRTFRKSIINITFIKFSGKGATEFLRLPVSIEQDELSDIIKVEINLREEIKKFLDTHFSSETNPAKWKNSFDINQRLEKHDSTIMQLHAVISNLSKTVSSQASDAERKQRQLDSLSLITEYMEVSKMDIWGLDIHAGPGFSISSGLSNLMHKIFTIQDKGEGQRYYINENDDALIHIDNVIKSFPKFPFSYFAKSYFLKIKKDKNWLGYAQKAKKIFEITTKIEGHNKQHEQFLMELNSLLLE